MVAGEAALKSNVQMLVFQGDMEMFERMARNINILSQGGNIYKSCKHKHRGTVMCKIQSAGPPTDRDKQNKTFDISRQIIPKTFVIVLSMQKHRDSDS